MITLEHGLLRDEELAERIHATLIGARPLNPLALPVGRVTVDRGRVTLSGNVATASQAVAIARQVSELPGVTAVASELVDDGSLTLAVWTALANIPDLRGVDRRLRVVFGTVHVDWAHPAAQFEALVDSALAGVRGVRDVVHGLWPEGDYRRGAAA